MGRTQSFGQSLDMSLPSPSSPCAHSEADEDVPQADDAEADDQEEIDADAAVSAQGGDDSADPTPLLVSFAKGYFVINPKHIRFDQNAPYETSSGSSMFTLHDSKSFKMWSEKHVIRPRHIIKVVAKGQCCWYIRFCVEGSPSDDRRIARAVHKQIAKRFFDLWNKEWPSERKEKYAELLRDEPSDMKQISPDRVGWKQVEAPEDIFVLYERPKGKKKESDAPLQGEIVKVGGKASKNKLAKLPVVDDDDQSSAAASAPTATPEDTAIVGFRQPSAQMAMGSAPNIFLQTPGEPLTHEHARTPRTPLTLPFGTISQAWSPSRRPICSSSSRISARALERRRQGGGERGWDVARWTGFGAGRHRAQRGVDCKVGRRGQLRLASWLRTQVASVRNLVVNLSYDCPVFLFAIGSTRFRCICGCPVGGVVAFLCCVGPPFRRFIFCVAHRCGDRHLGGGGLRDGGDLEGRRVEAANGSARAAVVLACRLASDSRIHRNWHRHTGQCARRKSHLRSHSAGAR